MNISKLLSQYLTRQMYRKSEHRRLNNYKWTFIKYPPNRRIYSPKQKDTHYFQVPILYIITKTDHMLFHIAVILKDWINKIYDFLLLKIKYFLIIRSLEIKELFKFYLNLDPSLPPKYNIFDRTLFNRFKKPMLLDDKIHLKMMLLIGF